MSETDRCLKDHLNTNQAKRERMCLEILTVQPGYSDIRPRLPKGGPDGGRDIQGLYKNVLCFGAVGFVNDATDTNQHRAQIEGKFKDDLNGALKNKADSAGMPKAFVFFTNVGLTPGITAELQKSAYSKGIDYCDIFDRERMRVALDSNRGYAIRLRYLDIPLNDAEQKDFFSAWGDEINSAISAGFQGIDQTTKRIQFLLEAQLPLVHLATIVKLNTSVWDACKGKFFFQTALSLRLHSEGLIGMTFGGGNNEILETPEEWEAKGRGATNNSQYGFGFSWISPDTPQYAQFADYGDKIEHPKNAKGESRREDIRTSRSSGVLGFDQRKLHFGVLSQPFLERFEPTCKLLELDGCWILFECNKEIADHIEGITIVGGGYELLKLSGGEIRAEPGKYDRLKIPMEATQTADSHEWVTLRPTNFSSCFSVDLMAKTPRRYDWSR